MPAAGSWEALVGRRLTIDVPASSANLGAGYDCLGLALELTNRVTVEALEETRGPGAIELEVTGEGAGELPATRDNRFIAGLERVLETALGQRPPAIGWHVSMHNDIPLSRGLGSSAAATVGGAAAGNALVGDALTPDALLQVATMIETHPDNAAAVLLGGFVVSAHLVDRVAAVRFDAPAGLRCVLFIPERRLSTEVMRGVLPTDVPLRHAVENLGRVAIGVAGIATRPVRSSRGPHRGPAPRAVSVRVISGAATADRRRARGRGARRVPVGRRVDGPRVHRARRGQRAGGGGVPSRGGGLRARRADRDRRAPQPRAGGRGRLSGRRRAPIRRPRRTSADQAPAAGDPAQVSRGCAPLEPGSRVARAGREPPRRPRCASGSRRPRPARSRHPGRRG